MDSASRSVNGWSFGIIAVVAASMVAISWRAMSEFDTATDVVAVVASILGPLAGIGAAAFGIKLGADAKATAKKKGDEMEKVALQLNEELQTRSMVAGDPNLSVDISKLHDLSAQLLHVARS